PLSTHLGTPEKPEQREQTPLLRRQQGLDPTGDYGVRIVSVEFRQKITQRLAGLAREGSQLADLERVPAEPHADRLGSCVLFRSQRTAELLLDNGKRLGKLESAECDRLALDRHGITSRNDEPALWNSRREGQQLVRILFGRVDQNQRLPRVQPSRDFRRRAPGRW